MNVRQIRKKYAPSGEQVERFNLRWLLPILAGALVAFLSWTGSQIITLKLSTNSAGHERQAIINETRVERGLAALDRSEIREELEVVKDSATLLKETTTALRRDLLQMKEDIQSTDRKLDSVLNILLEQRRAER